MGRTSSDRRGSKESRPPTADSSMQQSMADTMGRTSSDRRGSKESRPPTADSSMQQSMTETMGRTASDRRGSKESRPQAVQQSIGESMGRTASESRGSKEHRPPTTDSSMQQSMTETMGRTSSERRGSKESQPTAGPSEVSMSGAPSDRSGNSSSLPAADEASMGRTDSKGRPALRHTTKRHATISSGGSMIATPALLPSVQPPVPFAKFATPTAQGDALATLSTAAAESSAEVPSRKPAFRRSNEGLPAAAVAASRRQSEEATASQPSSRSGSKKATLGGKVLQGAETLAQRLISSSLMPSAAADSGGAATPGGQTSRSQPRPAQQPKPASPRPAAFQRSPTRQGEEQAAFADLGSEQDGEQRAASKRMGSKPSNLQAELQKLGADSVQEAGRLSVKERQATKERLVICTLAYRAADAFIWSHRGNSSNVDMLLQHLHRDAEAGLAGLRAALQLQSFAADGNASQLEADKKKANRRFTAAVFGVDYTVADSSCATLDELHKINRFWTSIDLDCSGEVDFAEFLCFFGRLQEGRLPGMLFVSYLVGSFIDEGHVRGRGCTKNDMLKLLYLDATEDDLTVMGANLLPAPPLLDMDTRLDLLTTFQYCRPDSQGLISVDDLVEADLLTPQMKSNIIFSKRNVKISCEDFVELFCPAGFLPHQGSTEACSSVGEALQRLSFKQLDGWVLKEEYAARLRAIVERQRCSNEDEDESDEVQTVVRHERKRSKLARKMTRQLLDI
eukprot:TRINITY_DN7313_c0_g2_i1.p1 TRINITY_DN7313_c0_g2~~TRINITY_DN7313_c0_g2_i1.p1  ORF type:complete len:738 (+),score=150.58 TRINITY_DN7313_c0_g2_i1:433-2646(+)